MMGGVRQQNLRSCRCSASPPRLRIARRSCAQDTGKGTVRRPWMRVAHGAEASCLVQRSCHRLRLPHLVSSYAEHGSEECPILSSEATAGQQVLDAEDGRIVVAEGVIDREVGVKCCLLQNQEEGILPPVDAIPVL